MFLLRAHRPERYRETLDLRLELRAEAERIAAKVGRPVEEVLALVEGRVPRDRAPVSGRRPGPGDLRRILALAELELELAPEPAAGSDWLRLARPEQLPPGGAWRTWLLLAGRGFGKTRAGAETINRWAWAGTARRIAVVAQTAADVRQLSMAALQRAAGPGATFTESHHFRLRWPNGAEALGFSAEEPDSLRGYEFDAAWSDELAAWRYPEAYDQLQFGLRAPGARQIVTTTPRPVRLMRELLADPTTVVTRGRTLDNAANLDPASIRYYMARYGGTRLGRQELDAELLDDVPGALWTRDQIDELRVGRGARARPDRGRDRPGRLEQRGRPTRRGIVVGGQGSRRRGLPPRRPVGQAQPRTAGPGGPSLRTGPGAPIGSSPRSTTGATSSRRPCGRWTRASPYRAVHASRGKRTRAEPIAALYEQGRDPPRRAPSPTSRTSSAPRCPRAGADPTTGSMRSSGGSPSWTLPGRAGTSRAPTRSPGTSGCAEPALAASRGLPVARVRGAGTSRRPPTTNPSRPP